MQLQRAEERREAAEARAKELEKQVFMISITVHFCTNVWFIYNVDGYILSVV